MSAPFDPYYTWLGIPREEQPPDFYRLVAVRRFENNPEVITNALQARETLVRSFESGPRAEAARQILDELAKARECLLHLESKGAYDRELRSKDAPKLTMTSSNRRPVRPDAPRRPSAANVLVPESADVAPGTLSLSQPADPVYTSCSGELISAGRSIHAPKVYSARAQSPMGTRLALLGLVGVLFGLSLLVIVIGVGWGAWTLLARLPDELPRQQRTSNVDRLVIVSKDDGASDSHQPAAGPSELRLVVGDARDLLAGFDPQRHAKPPGCMVNDGKGWVPSGRSVYEVMFFPDNLPEEYVLEATLTLLTDSRGIVQGLVAGGKQCHITVDGFNGERDGRGMRTALEAIDGRTPHDLVDYPGVNFGTLLRHDRPAELRYVVLKDRILVECDGTVVLDWTGGLNRVSPNERFVAGDQQNLFWGTWQTKCRLSKFAIRPILEVK